MSNTTRTIDWSTLLVGFAFSLFLFVAVAVLGGWVFANAWNSFVVTVSGLPTIETGDGIMAILLLYVSGWAFGLRRGKAK